MSDTPLVELASRAFESSPVIVLILLGVCRILWTSLQKELQENRVMSVTLQKLTSETTTAMTSLTTALNGLRDEIARKH